MQHFVFIGANPNYTQFADFPTKVKTKRKESRKEKKKGYNKLRFSLIQTTKVTQTEKRVECERE